MRAIAFLTILLCPGCHWLFPFPPAVSDAVDGVARPDAPPDVTTGEGARAGDRSAGWERTSLGKDGRWLERPRAADRSMDVRQPLSPCPALTSPTWTCLANKYPCFAPSCWCRAYCQGVFLACSITNNTVYCTLGGKSCAPYNGAETYCNACLSVMNTCWPP